MKKTAIATVTAISLGAAVSSQAAITFTESFNTVETGNINDSYSHITETGSLFGGVGVEDGGAATPGTNRLWAFFQTGNAGSDDAAITIDLGAKALVADGATINFGFDLGVKNGQQFDEAVVVRFLDGAGGTQVGSTFTVDPPSYDVNGIQAVSSSITLAGDTTNNLFMEITFDAKSNTTFHQGLLDEVVVNQVPEPSSAALLGLGGLALILRRRK